MENISKNAAANTVPAAGQLDPNQYVRIYEKPLSKLKVLFVGNSITRHAPAPGIGWYGDWGMAASAPEKDYVHRALVGLESFFGDVSCCVAQAAVWERRYEEGAAPLEEFYLPARDFEADVVVIRIGENIDRGKLEKFPVKPFYEKMVRFFAKKPDALVVCTDNFWKIPALDERFAEACRENGWHFCHIGDLENDENTMAKGLFEHHGVAAHPSDLGMQRIADRICGAVFASV